MSIFSGFAAWAEKEWTAFRNEAPKLEQDADMVLKYAAGALQIALSIEGANPAISTISGVINTAMGGITAASGLIYDFGATPTAAGMLTAVSNDLSGLLAAAHVTDPKSVAAVTKTVAEVNGLVKAMGTPAV